MRFGGRTTLTKHRRCMPEIIGFSNRIAYEPEGVRLVPVRQYGADRLEPIKSRSTFRAGYKKKGVRRGVESLPRSNAVVAQIEDCLADPRYDGMTMGVISLLGTAQAKAIEGKVLLERLFDPEDWMTHHLRCGDSAEFQGSERDVMFLSMVKAPEEDRRERIGALTAEISTSSATTLLPRAPRTRCGSFTPIRPLNDLGQPRGHAVHSFWTTSTASSTPRIAEQRRPRHGNRGARRRPHSNRSTPCSSSVCSTRSSTAGTSSYLPVRGRVVTSSISSSLGRGADGHRVRR